jgi:hypothetical protein
VKLKMPDDDTLRRYLLGQLPEPERDKLEDHLVVDADGRAEVEAVERDLIDDYVRGGLEGDEKDHFERLFLSSPRRQQKVTFARTLKDVADTSPVTSRNADSQIESRSWLSLLFPKQLAAGFALTAAVLLIIAVVWVVTNRQQQAPGRVGTDSNTSQGEQAAVPVNSTPEERITPNKGSNEQTAVMGNNATPSMTPSQRAQQTPSVASFLILPGSLRGSDEGQVLTIPARAQSVRLRLSLEGQPATGAVRAELRRASAEGELVWITGIVRATRSSLGPVVSIEVPADKLPAGKYTILIKGAGPDGRVETVYAFSVTRK